MSQNKFLYVHSSSGDMITSFGTSLLIHMQLFLVLQNAV